MASIAVEHAGESRLLGLKPIQWMMIGIVVVALGFGGWSLSGSLARAVTIEEAKAASGTVQVFGYIYSKGEYDEQHNWTFQIQDHDGQILTVSHPTKPGNFDDAISVSATGRFDAERGVFHAEQLLVKCPSKYQEMERTLGAEANPHKP
jgi:cytochrome c-type biogenesis protein CcmE